jgi:hypothetical protein
MDATPVSSEIGRYESEFSATHAHGSLHIDTIRAFERLAARTTLAESVETGCGKSTILFSNISLNHTSFCIDDRSLGSSSSVNYFLLCKESRPSKVQFQYGPTQITLPIYRFESKLDLALLDGPHAFPFPFLEYYFIYPALREGAFLIVDDIHVPSVRALWEMVSEDEMFDVYDIIGNKTGILRRTSAETFDPIADGWWKQLYNRHRVPASNKYHLARIPSRIMEELRSDEVPGGAEGGEMPAGP